MYERESVSTRVFAFVLSAIHIGSNMIHAQVSECTHHHVGVCDLRGAYGGRGEERKGGGVTRLGWCQWHEPGSLPVVYLVTQDGVAAYVELPCGAYSPHFGHLAQRLEYREVLCGCA